jgi:hypothetical protein
MCVNQARRDRIFDERRGQVDGLMHGMRNVAQGVDDQFIEIVQ